MNQLKVVHICTSLEGGAGICASRIISATRELGVDACALVAYGNKNSYIDVVESEYPWSRFVIIRKIQVLLRIFGKWPKTARILKKIEVASQGYVDTYTFTSPITLYKNIANHPWVKSADIVHLHWVGCFVDYESFFKGINKPIVWSIHDHNPGLGGFHYTIWKDKAPIEFKKLDDEFVLLKKKAYNHVKSMTLVALSSMMADFFVNNKLLSRFPFTIIHNGIEESKFTPISKSCAREALSLPKGSNVFLFIAQLVNEDRKGLKELIAALEILNIPNTILLCIGRTNKQILTSLEVRYEGFITNNRIQSLYYSAADFFVMPSFQEVFAQTPMEAMACGTPVVAFPCSGAQDLINDKNGVVCSDFTIDALVSGIKTAMKRNYSHAEIREDVISRFSYEKIASQYIKLYQDIVNGIKN